MSTRVLSGVVTLALTVSLAACGGSAPPAADEAAAPAEASHAGHDMGRVFFAMPKDGDTVGTLATFEFAAENVPIDAVPPGDLTDADVRPGIGHFHLGVDTDCLPTGVAIPKADPWIHFGDGKNTIQMALQPGPHTFVVQIGDDLHRTVEGLCEKISVTVVE
jgi:hypothetical protein